jgi:signal transduction histidine kinase/CheY-like chemotaxis protein
MGHLKEENNTKYLLTSVLVFILSGLVVVFVWDKNYQDLIQSRQSNVRLTGNYISEKFKEAILDNVQALENVKLRLEETRGEYFEHWEFDAKLSIEQSGSFKFVEWIDKDGIIRMIYPPEGNEAAVGLDILALDYRRDEWLQAAEGDFIDVTHWLELIQSNYAFLVDVPVYFGDEFQGTITAGMDFTQLFDEILEDYPGYYVSIRDEFGTEFYTYGDAENSLDSADFSYTSNISLFEEDEYWSFTLRPSKEILDVGFFVSIGSRLLGFSLSLLLALFIYFFLKSRAAERRQRKLVEIQNELNERLKIEKKNAESASNAKSDFLSNMSHEIRTPLSAIMGLVEIMRFHKLEDTTKKYLSMLEVSSKNLLSLVNDILDLDKIESGRLELAQIEFNPREEIENLVEIHKPTFGEKGLYLDLSLSGEKDIWVKGDPGKFAQVINNLIRNAFKFTEKGGLKIKCKLRKVNKHLRAELSFKDTGIGIPKEKQQFIFERFTQLDSGLTREYEGTGLGLSISDRLLKLMGGAISLQSEKGGGATFIVEISFPLVISESEGEAGSHNSINDFGLRPVLIVDDTPINQVVLEKVLERFNIKVDKAENGEVAVSKVKNGNYELIFMDLHMPKKDGFEATSEIRKMGLDIPIIAITANVTQEAMEKAKEVGMQEYITKPYSSVRIHTVLEEYLQHHLN